jgi:hypothetical protein
MRNGERSGYHGFPDSPSGQFASFVKAEYDKWGKVVKKSGIYHGQ